MKSSLVSYRTTPYKALALPRENDVVVFDDLENYRTGGPGKLTTRVEMSRDKFFLFFKVYCYETEPEKINASNTADGSSLWGGDLLEIFFAEIRSVRSCDIEKPADHLAYPVEVSWSVCSLLLSGVGYISCTDGASTKSAPHSSRSLQSASRSRG